ncbi:hypothetical protein Fmac_012580 [Flemingia macrophylla]|uniref:MAPK kinase substrate protein n=1 Tax=Flemingia macrophylla TaxID=520843 RepID=A0ABD1MQR0_9FABA
MAGLQRSAVSFRRQGSSGIVWDDKLISEELNRDQHQNQKANNNDSNSAKTRSNAGGGYRTNKFSPAIDPPSPKLSACGCCTAFSKPRDKPTRYNSDEVHRCCYDLSFKLLAG